MMCPFPRGSYLPLLYLHPACLAHFGILPSLFVSIDTIDAVHAKECSWFGAFRVRYLEIFGDLHHSARPLAFPGGENQMKMVPGVC